MDKIGKHILTLLLLVAALPICGQVYVEAKIDSIAIFIGEQANIELSVTAQPGSKIQMPTYKPYEYLAPGVEIVNSSDADTASVDGKLKVSRTFTITSFDENLYAIPGLKVKVNGKDYVSNTLALKVITMDVDTLHPNQFFPPKDVQDNPFMWSEWGMMFWLGLTVVLLAAAAFYLIVRLRQNKPIVTRIRIVKKVLPHQKAMNAIDEIRNEKMAASEDQKLYYTRLTDTLRQYIEERFGFNAMEMTSSEILYNLKVAGDQAMIDELKELFYTADLVKFAKHSALINENDLNLINAINFIDQTKLEGQPTEERIVPQLSDDDKRSRKNRITIKSLLAVIVVIVVIIMSYLVYHIYQLTN
ncbi:MAG: BatD family protein [Prevotella sp.]